MEYYRTTEGKFKKGIQNGKRGKGTPTAALGNGQMEPDLISDGSSFDTRMVSYVWMVTSLVESRPVSLSEILEMLARTVRQHSMVRARRIDYVLAHMRENAP